MSHRVDLANKLQRKEGRRTSRTIHLPKKNWRLVSAITTANIYQHVMAIVNQQAKASKGPCFKFARGACSDEHCKWSHDSAQQTTSRQENRQAPMGRERQQREFRGPRESSNNNFRQNHAGTSRPTNTPFIKGTRCADWRQEVIKKGISPPARSTQTAATGVEKE